MIRVAVAAAVLLLAAVPALASTVQVTWSPAEPRPGDAVHLQVTGAPDGARVEAVLGGRPLPVFRDGHGHRALAGVDVDEVPGPRPWTVTVHAAGHETFTVGGMLTLQPRSYAVQHLTLPPTMVDLPPETERRALAEAAVLRALYATVTPERLWSGAFVRPLGGDAPGTGFGSRRVINGKPRAPHTGVDYPAPLGTPVLAANAGRVALTGEFFFPGRLVVVDHGLGVYSLYFHLDRIAVAQGDRVGRGQAIGAVGATGRATGPHLHFGVLAAGARIDPSTLLGLPLPD